MALKTEHLPGCALKGKLRFPGSKDRGKNREVMRDLPWKYAQSHTHTAWRLSRRAYLFSLSSPAPENPPLPLGKKEGMKIGTRSMNECKIRPVDFSKRWRDGTVGLYEYNWTVASLDRLENISLYHCWIKTFQQSLSNLFVNHDGDPHIAQKISSCGLHYSCNTCKFGSSGPTLKVFLIRTKCTAAPQKHIYQITREEAAMFRQGSWMML